ncbi:MAG: hypothetical protein NC409_14150 [Clostridium sp.]|nr:hypothetical protein [Clostridium sp.]
MGNTLFDDAMMRRVRAGRSRWRQYCNDGNTVTAVCRNDGNAVAAVCHSGGMPLAVVRVFFRKGKEDRTYE